MGTLSDFGWKMQATRERLCCALVCKLLPVQAGDANHELAMEYCLQNLEQHRFGDVNPVAVEELYASLSDRLGSHSQLEKQRALSRLVKSLLSYQLDSQQPEPQHNALCLVYWLARRPLDSAYIPPYSEGTVAGHSLSEASEGDSVSEWGDDAAVYSSHSELSEWNASDADSVQDPEEALQVTDQTAPGEAEIANRHAMKADPVAKGCSASHIDRQPPSPLMLIQQLRQRLAAHLPRSQQHDKLTALADQMRPIWAELVHLEENLHPGKSDMRPQPQLPVTLLGLEYQLQGVVWRAGLLGHILEEALRPQEQAWPLGALPITAADLSSSLVSRLQGMLHHYSLQGGPRDQTVCVDSPYFWNEAFALQHTASGQVACPAFLQPLAQGVLSTGKSLLLLRAHQDQHRRDGLAAASARSQWQGPTAAVRVGRHQGGTVLQPASEGSLSQRFLHSLRLTVQASEQPAQLNSNASLTTAQDPGRAISSTQPNPSPTLPHRTKPSQGSGGVQPGSSPSTTPSYGLGMKQAQDSSWDGAKNSPSLSVGQRMKKSQASWLPQPLSACPLTTSAPSPAAYALPQQAKRAATAELHCAVLQKQCPSQVSGHMDARHGAHGEPGPARDQDSSEPQTSLDRQQSTAQPAQQQPQQQQQSTAWQQQSTAQQHHTDLLTQQQTKQQQEARLADCAVLEWCSKAEELMQRADGAWQDSPAEPAVPVQSPFGTLQRHLTALPAYSGKRMFGKGSNDQDNQSGDKEWVEGLQAVDLPPVDTLMQACLLQPIQEQIDLVGGVLLQRLLGEWGLMHQLAILRNVFLLGCPLMVPFASALYGRLHKGHKLTSLSHFELEVMLQQSLADLPPHRPGDHALPPPNTLSVELVQQHPSISTPTAGSREARSQGNVVELLPLRLHYKVPWPLSMIVDDTVLLKYNQVLIFLLQIRWAKWSLERARVKAGRGEAGRCLDVLAHQLSHFVNTLHQFVMDRLLHGAWLELQQALEVAKSLEEVTTAHSKFVDAAQRQCLLAPDKTWKLIEGVVVQILNQVLQFAELQQRLRKPGTKVSQAEVQRQLEQLHINFRDRHRYLLKVLTARTLKIGGQSELHYLVMHINFNSFYAKADDMY
ncbi:hypothetical protein ABBQ32_011094 [Trebouxia sp. C0010 RCD-2024]